MAGVFGPDPAAAQTATAINERAGMYSCTCADGRNAGPIVAPGVAIAWQQYDSLNSRLSTLAAKLISCFDAKPGTYKYTDCTLSKSEEASIRGRLASIRAQATMGQATASAQCAAACLARAASPTTSSNAGSGGKTAPASTTSGSTAPLPVGNDWSLDNTISGRKPLQPSDTQRKWEEERRKTLQQFKPIRRSASDGSPSPASSPQQASEPAAPKQPDGGAMAAETPFKPVRPAPTVQGDIALPPAAPPKVDDRSDPDLDAAIADELLDPNGAAIRQVRAEAALRISRQLPGALPEPMLRELAMAARAWGLYPNPNMNPSKATLDALRQKALQELEQRAKASPLGEGTDIRVYFRSWQLFESRVLPALDLIDKQGPKR
ncbi:MAG: hypothetical protein A3H96_23605 [Acidobacteria bacterium RIFCSPLOWO2_02_FULL_67_36]|nr:MAG: hypothetical protein A3H96_23605 [Acidobacteria bacterium RIFCSPLOWO2_02_FULL_67_36]OFW20533.1 MAG: hypothetical protein A3G21_23215 [Acidobacteria bacterium RIFCSPLOWO2_12_FULL_66_21]